MKMLSSAQSKLFNDEVARLYDKLNSLDPGTEEYKKSLDSLGKLYDLRKKSLKVSPDTLMVVGGNLAGILLILGYEKANVITSKAIGFVLRGRV